MLDFTSGGSRASKPVKANRQQSNTNPVAIDTTTKGETSTSRKNSVMPDVIVSSKHLEEVVRASLAPLLLARPLRCDFDGEDERKTANLAYFMQVQNPCGVSFGSATAWWACNFPIANLIDHNGVVQLHRIAQWERFSHELQVFLSRKWFYSPIGKRDVLGTKLRRGETA